MVFPTLAMKLCHDNTAWVQEVTKLNFQGKKGKREKYRVEGGIGGGGGGGGVGNENVKRLCQIVVGVHKN